MDKIKINVITPTMFVPSGLAAVEKEVENIKQMLATKQAERAEVIKKSILLCGACSGTTTIGETVYIQTEWYVSPRGCSDGDYWKDGEGRYLCPHCDSQNRLYNNPEICAYDKYFKEIIRQKT